MSRVSEHNASVATVGDLWPDFVTRATALCRTVAGRDLTGLPLYILLQSEVAEVMGRENYSDGYTTHNLDLNLRSIIGDRWHGRGPCIVLNDVSIADEHFPEDVDIVAMSIVFHELAQSEVMQMVDLMTKRLTGQLEGQGLGIELTQSAKELLAVKGYDPQLGARPLRRAIQRMIEDVLSEKILYKEFSAGQIIVVDAEEDPENQGKKRFAFRSVEGFQVPEGTVLAETTDGNSATE